LLAREICAREFEIFGSFCLIYINLTRLCIGALGLEFFEGFLV
jgi:hypothetical protein